MNCPNCNHLQTGTVECEKCGIIFEKYYPRQSRMQQPDETSPSSKPHANTAKKVSWIRIIGTLFFLFLGLAICGPLYLNHTIKENRKKQLAELDEEDRMLFTSISTQVSDYNHPENPLERARNATVVIKTPWSMGSGFFIDDQWH